MPRIPKELVNTVLELGKEKATELAGIGITTISKHFPNKENLVEALIQREADLHLQILETKYAEIKDQPFEEIINTLVVEIAKAMGNGKVALRVILTSTFATERLQSIIQARESLVTFVEKVLKDGGYTQKTSLKAYTIVAALGGMVETIVFRKDETFSEEILAEETTKLVLAYCKEKI